MADPFKRVLFNDGEGITVADFNALQTRLQSMVLDGVLSWMGRISDFDGTDLGASDDHLFCVGNSGAPYAGGSNRQTKFLGGPIFQRVDSGMPDGAAPQLLMYYLDDNEAGVTHAAPSVNPRFDLISVKLELEDADSESRDFKDAVTGALSSQTLDKSSRVAATITVTQGAEAAAPVEPALPAGHVKLAAIKVPTAAVVIDPLTNIRDYRMPIGSRVIHQCANLCWEFDPKDTSYLIDPNSPGPGKLGRDTSGGGGLIWLPLSEGGSSARVLRLYSAMSSFHASTAVWLGRYSDRGAEETAIWNVSVAALAAKFVMHDVLASFPDPLGGADVGVPFWSNGRTCGYAIDATRSLADSAGTTFTTAAVRLTQIAADAFTLHPWRWWLAGGV